MSVAGLTIAALLLGGCIDAVYPIQAATPEVPKDVPSGFEIVVFERPDCATCLLFRRDIAPRYIASIRGGTAPLRFVDLSIRDPAARSAVEGTYDGLLAKPLRLIPTAVIIEDGREFARIEGYTGPDNFFQMVAHAFKMHAGRPPATARKGPITRN